SRRMHRQAVSVVLDSNAASLFHVQERIQVEHGESELTKRLHSQKLHGSLLFSGCRRSYFFQKVGQLRLGGGVVGGFTAKSIRERRGQIVRQSAVEQFQ